MCEPWHGLALCIALRVKANASALAASILWALLRPALCCVGCKSRCVGLGMDWPCVSHCVSKPMRVPWLRRFCGLYSVLPCAALCVKADAWALAWTGLVSRIACQSQCECLGCVDFVGSTPSCPALHGKAAFFLRLPSDIWPLRNPGRTFDLYHFSTYFSFDAWF